MSLQTRLGALITAIGADVKKHNLALAIPRVVKQWDGAHGAGTAIGIYGMNSGSFGVYTPTVGNLRPASWFYYLAADWDIPGKTTEWAIRVTGGRNAVAPSGTYTFTPLQLTNAGGAGGANLISYTTAGAVKTGPRVAQSMASVPYFAAESPWLTAPAAGWVDNEILAMSVGNSAIVAASSLFVYSVQLLVRWVP